MPLHRDPRWHHPHLRLADTGFGYARARQGSKSLSKVCWCRLIFRHQGTEQEQKRPSGSYKWPRQKEERRHGQKKQAHCSEADQEQLITHSLRHGTLLGHVPHFHDEPAGRNRPRVTVHAHCHYDTVCLGRRRGAWTGDKYPVTCLRIPRITTAWLLGQTGRSFMCATRPQSEGHLP